MASLVPIFPLHLVTFPYHSVRLRVFEDRYRAMVEHCQSSGQGFVISRLFSGSEVGGPSTPYRVGTLMSIVEQTEDERFIHLECVGLRRVRCTHWDRSMPYLQAKTEPFEDLVADDGNKDGLLDLWRTYLERILGLTLQQVHLLETSELFRLELPEMTLALAPFMRLPYMHQQFLLELRDPNQRRENLMLAMQAALEGRSVEMPPEVADPESSDEVEENF